MPFQIEVTDIQALYNALNSGFNGIIGDLLIKKPPIEMVTTYLKTEGSDYSLESLLYPTQEFTYSSEFKVPNKKIEEKLSSKYKIEVSDPRQMIVENNGRRYFMYQKTSNSLYLDMKQKISTLEDFKTNVNEFIEILGVYVKSFYKDESDIPNLKYIIGRNLELFNREKGFIFRGLDKFAKIQDPLDLLERKIEIVNPNISFDDIGGCILGKQEMMRIYHDIENPGVARFFGRDPDKNKGYLLLGEQGSGKTLLVKALATKLKGDLGEKVKFYEVRYGDITSIFRGGEALGTEGIFDLVMRNEKNGIKTLLFLDEIHVVGQRRGGYNEALDTLLPHLDGMRNYKGLTVIGATYMPEESLDPALIRPGRLGVKIRIERPNKEERIGIFGIYKTKYQKIAHDGKNPNLFGELDIETLAKESENLNGSQIAGLFETVIRSKEDETRKTVSENAAPEQIFEAFTPITTEDFVSVLTYKKEKKDGTGQYL